ncbi:probable leucine-rich repeat receptor-like serine/threonine-protein kinase At3g14840 isoform X2 [Diospyros lotus]|uniref:probable leucine-rich repeat receptor-like serine/threonine-protein kinase At3g14840 isoform X2 n=1 Tax=Diospyros lotus TaxID=55363 RepID=UPI00224CFCD4|nr:probable leucine-rich repeat receptor-like serine/threonine-protein kinase At3g14840 isoform X2 [Diospyros lotus]
MNTMIFFSRSLLSLVLLIICAISIFFPVSVSAASLAADEVDVLKQIGKTLGKKDWDFSVDPCSKEKGWVTQNPVKGSENAVNCTCSFNNNTVCHITSIVLKSQNLSGTLPTELVNLPYLQEIDFSRNYLNGTIPPEWGSTQLRNISLIVNRLTGPIPKELGNISTLLNLTVEFNQLSGLIPPEIGNLSRLEILHLSSNNFTGELPETLSKLTNLKEIRLSDNHFTGKIPNFIQSWTNLDKLVMHASGLEGPIPPGIRLLTKITDLRISDLNGTQAPFPPLNDMTSLKYLILRNCNLNESLPEYLGAMTSLKTLDLSFNKLSGEIPGNFSSLAETDNIFLTRNLLSGPVPSWILEKAENVDLSFNNFTPSSGRCQEKQVNLFGSSLNGNTGILSCLSSTHCSRTWHSFHINCGGSKVVNVGSGTKYEADATPVATSLMVTESNSNWGFSSTGDFMDQGGNSKSFIQKNTSILSVKDPELYMDARLSPISLAYYGFCLKNENYKVNLHFAEIMFTDDKTYSSLGRRVFDIYIQGKLVEKDFNIVDKAGGASKSITMPYDATVTNGTLEIRFYWAGRGTTAVPVKGVYGPLISAISVDSEGGNGMSAGAVVGIVAAVAFVIILLLGILWWRGCLRRKDTMDEGPEEFQLKLDWQTRYKICIGIARGLAFLHEESRLKIVHRDIKATNVLLDKNLNPKISDFGLAKLDEEDNTHISTRIAGTYGYMAPEYAMHGYLTDKADVYSFGIVALEIASGRSNTSFRAKEPCFNLLDRTLELKAEGRLTELVDPKLGSAFNRDEAMVMIDVALLCTNAAASVRPAMSSVVSMLEGRTVVKEPLSYGTKSHDQVKFKGKMDEWKHSQETKMTEDSQIQGMPIDGPWTGSSASAGDLYPISLNSDYWKNRD